MNKLSIVLVSVILTCVSPLLSYERLETLVGGKNNSGVFVAPVAKYTMMNDKWGLMFGGRAALVVNHSFNIGAGYYGLVNSTMRSDALDAAGGKLDHKLRYGGLEFEYVVDSDYLGHPTFVALLGAGTVGYDGTPMGSVNDDSSSFFVFEPGLNFELNVTRNFRTDLGIYYRMVTGVDSESLSNSKVNGPSIALTLKFGTF